jgi:energy-coupling factor transport system substrate-specific component
LNMKSLDAKRIALVGLFAALLTGGQLALAALPNIEVVTLFIILFSLTFGFNLSILGVLAFCLIEASVFGFHSWVIAYFIYWPTLTFIVSLLNRLGYKKNIVYIITGVVMTALFGFLTSLVDTLFAYSSAGVGFFRLFFAIYIRGVWFYVTHIVSNAFFLSIAFPVLRLVLIKVKAAYFS